MKKISPVVVVGLLLTIGCLIFYRAETMLAQKLSFYAYDAFLNAVHDDPQSQQVVIVDIDDKSLQAVGQWPWSRYLVAAMTAGILEQGASVVAFDVVFPEKDRTSPAVLKEVLNQDFGLDVKIEGLPEDLQDFDARFAMILEAGNTVLGCFMHQATNFTAEADASGDPFFRSRIFTMAPDRRAAAFNNIVLLAADKVMASIPVLDKVTETAFFNAVPDFDNVVRSNPLVMALGDKRIYPSLALEAVRMHVGASKCILHYDERGVLDIQVGDLVIPTDHRGRLVVNYRTVKEDARAGFFSSFPMYSALDVLSGSLPEGAFKGKIVFVGTSAVGLKDMRATPLTGDFSGVEIHATMVDNILEGDMLRVPWWLSWIQALVILVVGVFLTMLISRGRSWLSFLISTLVILGAIGITLLLFRYYHYAFVPAWVAFSVIIIYPVLTTIKFWQEEYQKRQVRHMFGTMVSQDVLQYLEKNPESFSLSGQKAEATMFFSDVAGFTTISESLEPDRLSDLLNRYLSPMTDIIMRRNGYVDKYEGDAIMAEWGVPFPMPDHAKQACLAALEQQAELAELRPWLLKAFGHEIHVRMGMNSGTVTAGNMGSDKRFSYTVMGDAVNQAARFEPANKDYDTRIMIGETTRDAARDVIEVRLLDKIVVKGKTLPISIYELLAKKGELPDRQAEIAGLYEEALKLHWDKEWDQALGRLDRAIELDFGDGPSIRLRKRISRYKAEPPPESWSGEYVRATKD